MRILLIGATGTIGQAIAQTLAARHDLILASRHKAAQQVDITNPDSIRALFGRVGKVDAIVSAAGQAAFKPLGQLTDGDFTLSLGSKPMGQVNLVRFGLGSVNDRGSITLTAGSWPSIRRRAPPRSAWSTPVSRDSPGPPHSRPPVAFG